MSDKDFLIVLTTMPADDRAEALATALIEARLAACVQVHPPMQSVYRWTGAIERESERQVVIKTLRRQLTRLEARVRELHPYDVPEWIVLAAENVSAAYLRWALDETSGAADTR